ncbi:CCR4-NOT transcription complex subunit 6-like isoform X3 [Ornithodoros turicata]
MSRPGLRDKEKDKYDSPSSRRTHSIMCAEDVAAGKKSHWPELEITGIIRNLSPSLWQLSHLTSLYLNDNSLSRLPPGIGRLVGLTHLDLSCNKLRSLPAELGDLVMLRELLLSHNCLRVLPYEIGKLFRLHVLGLKGNPLSPEILSVYSEPNGTSKLLAYLLDNLAVTSSHPPQRPWIAVAHPTRTQTSTVFTVMCYNVLCDKYATRQVYGYCPSWALGWEYRRKGIMDEIRHYAADIISLQAVETEQFHGFFLPELKRDGYDGIFSPKSRAKTMSESDRKHVDGCAIFYRTNKFTLLKEHLVEFNQLAMANAEGSDDMLNRVMTKDNIGLAALLQIKDSAFDNVNMDGKSCLPQQQPLLVCTAHIHWDPEYCDVKLIQTMMLMRELRSILEEAGQSLRNLHRRTPSDANSIPLLLCGDLNSLPESGVIEFLKTGHVSADHPDFKELGYKDCLRKMCLESDALIGNTYTHPFRIREAYTDGVMPYTNYTFDFKGVIDYIFFSRQHMSVLGVLGPLDPQWLQDNKVVGCPHPHVPSDHFPLLAQLEMTLPNGLVQRR